MAPDILSSFSSPSWAADTLFSRLQSRVASWPRGTIFFAEDLEDLCPDAMTVRTNLARMASDGLVAVRLARGVYCHPEVSADFRMILPSPEAVAEALARRSRCRIVPCGAQAAYLAGLTDLNMYELDYLTDGSEREIHLGSGRTIRFFRRQSVKVFSFRSEALRNLSEGFRYLGSERIGAGDREVAARVLREIPEGDYRSDLKLCPGWMREEFRAIRP